MGIMLAHPGLSALEYTIQVQTIIKIMKRKRIKRKMPELSKANKTESL
jgi:hypothetical protein